jgi:hypothetical protein
MNVNTQRNMSLLSRPRETQRISNSNIGIFIDKSLSTEGIILEIEKDIAAAFKSSESVKYVGWSNRADVAHNLRSICSTGGTIPSCIFNCNKTNEIYNTSDVFVIITDGDINDCDVIHFNKNICSRNMKPMAIGVFVGDGEINMSVFAALMNFHSVLILSRKISHKTCEVVFSKNVSGVEAFDLSKINDIEFDSRYKALPSSAIILSDTDTTINYTDFSKLDLAFKSDSDIDWDNLCQKAKMMDNLESINALISGFRKEEIDKLPSVIAHRELVAKIIQLKAENRNHESESSELRNICISNDPQYKSTVAKWNAVRQTLRHYETVSYSEKGFCNRVKRAATIVQDPNDIVFPEDNPLVDCSICLTQGPAVIWVKKPNQCQLMYNNFTLNYPLGLSDEAYDEIFKDVFVANPVCGHCANCYDEMCQKTVFREEKHGYISYKLHNIYRLISDGKVLPHVKMLLYAYIDGKKCPAWIDGEYLLNSMLDVIMTNDSFSDIGNKVTLRQAMSIFPTSDEYLLRQPMNAVTRILKNRENVHDVLTKRLYYHYIERFSALTTTSAASIAFRQYILNLLSKTRLGLMTIESVHDIRDISLIDDTHFGIKTPYFHDTLRNLISEDAMRHLLKYLLNPQHNRPMQIYSRYRRGTISKAQMVHEIISKYHKRASSDDAPCYAIYLGRHSSPTKAWLKVNNELKCIRNLPLDKRREAMETFLMNEYGTAVPSETSDHFNMHKIVAKVMEGQFKGENEWRPEMLRAVVKKVKFAMGNIYKHSVIRDITLGILDFMRIRKAYVAASYKFNCSFEEKCRIEDQYYPDYPGTLLERYADLDIQAMIDGAD